LNFKVKSKNEVLQVSGKECPQVIYKGNRAIVMVNHSSDRKGARPETAGFKNKKGVLGTVHTSYFISSSADFG
jgi:hypothetical protein